MPQMPKKSQMHIERKACEKWGGSARILVMIIRATSLAILVAHSQNDYSLTQSIAVDLLVAKRHYTPHIIPHIPYIFQRFRNIRLLFFNDSQRYFFSLKINLADISTNSLYQWFRKFVIVKRYTVDSRCFNQFDFNP